MLIVALPSMEGFWNLLEALCGRCNLATWARDDSYSHRKVGERAYRPSPGRLRHANMGLVFTSSRFFVLYTEKEWERGGVGGRLKGEMEGLYIRESEMTGKTDKPHNLPEQENTSSVHVRSSSSTSSTYHSISIPCCGQLINFAEHL